MKYPLARPLFPALEITPADEVEFVGLVAVFVDKLVSEENAFFTSGGQVDTIKWKHIKQTENAAVYHGRDVGEGASLASIVSLTSLIEGSGKRVTPRSCRS